jgi:hypothetical protein
MAGGGGQSSGTTTTVQKSDPWEGQQPYLLDIFSEAQKQYRSGGPQYFQGSTLAAPNAQQTQAQGMATQAATGAQQQLADTGAAGINYAVNDAIDVRNNPFLAAAQEGAIRPAVRAFTDPGGVLSNIRSDFGTNGQYGGSRQALATGTAAGRLGESILDTTSRMGSEAYTAGLDAQGRALALLPQIQQAQLAPAQTVAAVGDANQDYIQSLINEEIKRHNFQQSAPSINLANYQNLVQGAYGGSATGSVTQPIAQRNPFTGALGGAMAGAQLGSMVPGIGTGVGALAGALIGLF